MAGRSRKVGSNSNPAVPRSGEPPDTPPLLAPRLIGAIGFVSLAGLGIGLMLAGYLRLGAVISYFSALLTAALYWRWPLPIELFRFRRIELILALAMIVLETGVPIYIIISRSEHNTRRSMTTETHLATKQLSREGDQSHRIVKTEGSCSPAMSNTQIKGNFSVSCSTH
jgi:hypothetical protein